MDRWLDEVLTGAISLDFPRVIFKRGDISFQGSGHASWDSEDGARIRAVTDNVDAGRALMFGPSKPGRLIPRTELITFNGQTQDGWNVSCPPFASGFAGLSLEAESNSAVWACKPGSLIMTHGLGQAIEGRLIRAVLGPPPSFWFRHTTTNVKNEYFGRRSFSTDWMLAETESLGPVAARSRSDSAFEVRIALGDSGIDLDDLTIVGAVASAFSFVIGRQVSIIAYEAFRGQEEVRYLAMPRLPTHNVLPKPVRSSNEYVESMVAKSIDLFVTPTGAQVAEHLYRCWDTADNALSTRVAISAICLEGLIKLAANQKKPADAGYTTSDRSTFATWLVSSKEALSNRFYKRLKGFLGALDHKRPVDILWNWQKQGLMNVSTDDIKAWDSTRNVAAHAGFVTDSIDYAKLQELFNSSTRVSNLINRIALQLMGYDGWYTDYSSGYADTKFPRAPNDAL